MVILTSCSNLEKDVVGEWKMNDNCDPDYDEGTIRLTDNGTVTGIEGYKSYQIIDNDDEVSGDLVLESGVDNRTIHITLDGDKMNMSEDETAFSCTVKKVSD